MEKKRLEYIDMVKGIGIIGIVIMHSLTVPDKVIAWLSSFVLPLFFLISGGLISLGKEREGSMKNILCRKGRSLMLPFLWFSLIFILMEIERCMRGITDWEAVKDSIFCLVTLKGSSVLWFLPALFLSEISFLFLVKKFSVVSNCFLVLILTAVSYGINGILLEQQAAMAVVPGLFVLTDFFRTYLRALYALPLLCVSYYLFEKYSDFWKTEGKFSMRQMAGGICLFLAGIPISAFNGGFDFRTMVTGKSLVLAYVSISLSSVGLLLIFKNCRPFKPLLFFGKNSLIIMATHMDFYFLYVAMLVAYKVNNYVPKFNSVCFFVNVIGTVLVLEVICIMIINRFFPFLTGRRYPTRYITGTERKRHAVGFFRKKN